MVVWGNYALEVGYVGTLQVLDVDGEYKDARVQVLAPATKDEYVAYCLGQGGTVDEKDISQPFVHFYRVSHD